MVHQATDAGSTYVLGWSAAEQDRLIRQAALLAPLTERLFRAAGIGAGQRVLDIGSGVGDVSMIAAKLVGPSGTVVGVERNADYIARARDRIEGGLRGRHVGPGTRRECPRSSMSQVMTRICEIFTRSRATPGLGLDMFSVFQDAGLGIPAMHLEMPLGTESSIAEL